MRLVRLDVGYACAGLIVDSRGIITEAAPIFKWAIGKRFADVRRWRRIKHVHVYPEEPA